MSLQKYTRLKYLVSINTEHAESNEGYVGLENVESWSGRKIETNTPEAEGVALSYQKGDVLFGKLRPYLAKCYVAEEDACCSMEFLVMRPKKVVSKYLQYRILSAEFIDKVNMSTYGAKMPRANWSFIGNLKLDVPSMEEQQLIANYLDDRCSKIDAIIAEAKASIEEYKELKQAVIYEAVTKGLDKNVEMKTYNDWFDMCPANWKYEQIRYLYELRDERNFDPLSEVNLISLYTDRGVMQHSDIEKTSGNKAVTADGYKKVYPEDIVVNIILCWMGAMGRSEYQGVTSPAYDVYKPIGESVICSRYYHYLFRTEKFSKKCYTVGRGIMMMRWRTYSSQFKAIKVPVPTYKEQVEIANYLDTRTKQIDNLVEEKQSLIADLESYKKSLIYEVVTGKRKVVA